MSINSQDQNAFADGMHPILYVKDLEFAKQEELTILKFDNREYRGVITFGSAVCFQTKERAYLTFSPGCELRVEKNDNYESGNNNIARLA